MRSGGSFPLSLALTIFLPLLFVSLAFLNFGYVAIQDFPEWVYQGYIIEYIASGKPSSMFFVRDYPVPYTISQILLALSLAVFSPAISGLLVITLYFLLAAVFCGLFIRRYGLSEWQAAIFLLAVLILNSTLMNGYAGYQIGLALFTGWLALPRRLRDDQRLVSLLSILLFFAHGLAYASFCAVAGVFALYGRKVPSFIVAMLPAGALAVWYVVANTEPPQIIDELTISGPVQLVVYKAYTLMKAGGYHNFSVSGASDYHLSHLLLFAGVGANAAFAALLGLAVLYAGWKYRVRRWSAEIVAATGLAFLALVLPPAVGGIVNPGERLLYPALILFATVLFRPGQFPRLLSGLLTLSLLCGLALSFAGLVAVPVKKDIAAASAAPAGSPSTTPQGRLPGMFGHRMDQFSDVAAETQRLWQTRGEPLTPLTFTTSLVGTRR